MKKKVENYVSFDKNDELLEKHYEIWEKINNSIKNEFNKEPKYNKK